MRRLPVFFVVDVSESMVGDSLTEMQEAFNQILTTLRQDPYALETTHLSVIAFAGKSRTIMPMTDLLSFYPPELPVGGGTALGAALDHLMDEIDRSVVKTTVDTKGDWRPIVFLLTDGHPTDDPSRAIQRWNRDYRGRANLVAVSIGGQADHSVLRQLTDDTVVFFDSAPDAFTRFAKWISASVQATSRSVSTGQGDGISLSKTDADLLAPLELTPEMITGGSVDERYAIFVGRCEKNRQPYIIKFERHNGRIHSDDEFVQELMRERDYLYSSVTPVKNSYFELSDNSVSGATVDSDDLIGGPDCPYCDAPVGLAVHACQKIHCIDSVGEHICPWCGEIGIYGVGDGDDETGFAIGRGRG